ncbi:MAG: carbohydrate ABC transporter permease [Saccharofermentanales bacterium]
MGNETGTGYRTGIRGYFAYQWHEMKKYRAMYVFVAPYVLLFTLFVLLPVLISIFLGFTEFNIISSPKFVGISNYIRMFLSDEIFVKALQNTLIFAAITGPVGYILSFSLAWLINELPVYLRSTMTLIFYAPAISGNAYLIWAVLFSGDSYGYVNAILRSFGLIDSPVQWFTDVAYMRQILILVMLWVSIGTSFLAFRAGLQGIDRSLFESAAVDGVKNRWQELWYITLPSMRPQLMFGAVMSITASFGTGDLITQLSGFPTTDFEAHTLVHHLQDYGGIRFEMGYASSIATVLFLMMITSNMVIKKIISKVGN